MVAKCNENDAISERISASDKGRKKENNVSCHQPCIAAMKYLTLVVFTTLKTPIFTVLWEGLCFPQMEMHLFPWIILQFVYDTSKQNHPLCYLIHLRVNTIILKIVLHESIALFDPFITVHYWRV